MLAVDVDVGDVLAANVNNAPDPLVPFVKTVLIKFLTALPEYVAVNDVLVAV